MKLPPSLLLVLLTPLAALAQTPDAGAILQQVRPPTVALPPATGPGLRIEPQNRHSLPAGAAFRVSAIRISGNTRFPTASLQPLVADADGQDLSLAQLQERAARLAEYYHVRGYPLVQAIVPAQEIQDGVVVIEIIEARYGVIRLDNQSAVHDSLLLATLSPLVSGQEIEQSALDHPLLLLSDLPGITVNATLQSGATAGTADLVVHLPRAQAVTGNLTFDDYGNRYTGRERFGLALNLNNPFGHGDVLSLNGLTSGRGLNYARLGYESVLNGSGTRLGGSYSALHYILGDPLDALDAHGTAAVKSVWVKHPFVRTRNFNLYAQLQYDELKLRDHIDATAIRTDRHLKDWKSSVAGDTRAGGGTTVWRVDFTDGHVGFDNAAARFTDDATAGTNGGFIKLNGSVGHLRQLTPTNALYFAFASQWANSNLDSSEKMLAGGPYTVRAYDIGAVSGDTGYFGSAEFRHDLGGSLNSQWQAIAFVDSEHVRINHSAWTTGTNHATLSGAGVGLNWGGPGHWSGKGVVALPIGSNPSLAPARASARLWIELSRVF